MFFLGGVIIGGGGGGGGESRESLYCISFLLYKNTLRMQGLCIV